MPAAAVGTLSFIGYGISAKKVSTRFHGLRQADKVDIGIGLTRHLDSATIDGEPESSRVARRRDALARDLRPPSTPRHWNPRSEASATMLPAPMNICEIMLIAGDSFEAGAWSQAPEWRRPPVADQGHTRHRQLPRKCRSCLDTGAVQTGFKIPPAISRTGRAGGIRRWIQGCIRPPQSVGQLLPASAEPGPQGHRLRTCPSFAATTLTLRRVKTAFSGAASDRSVPPGAPAQYLQPSPPVPLEMLGVGVLSVDGDPMSAGFKGKIKPVQPACPEKPRWFSPKSRPGWRAPHAHWQRAASLTPRRCRELQVGG